MSSVPPLVGILMTEFYGTFFLTLTVAMTVNLNPYNPPLAIGTVLALLVYAGGHISGGHYNPAVTLGVTIRGKLPPKQAVMYWATQFLGGMLAGVIGNFVTNQVVQCKPKDGFNVGQAFLMETLFTFLLVSVVLAVATSKAVMGNDFFGFAIGMSVFVGASACGPVSGAALNPAVGLGLNFGAFLLNEKFKADGKPAPYDGDDTWIYFVAPLLGGAFAAAWYRVTSPMEFGTKKSGVMPPKGIVHTNVETSDPTRVYETQMTERAGDEETPLTQ